MFGLISCGSTKQVYKVNELGGNSLRSGAIYDEKSKLSYTISKDNTFAYVILNTSEKTTQIKMMQNGVRIYFDKEGKKNTDNFIHYPLTQKRKKMDIEALKKLRGNPEAILKKQQENIGVEILFSEKGEERIINNELNNEQISTEIKMSPNGLIYTLKFPLSLITSEAETQSIGIAIKGMELPEIGSRPSRGIRSLGGRGGGRGGRQRPDVSKLKELQSTINLWIPIQLK